jgi:hypothetical protein
MLHLRPSTLSDADALAPRLREDDLREVQACGVSPLDALRRGIGTSLPAMSIVNGSGEVVGVFGAVPLPGEPGAAAVWLLGSDGITKESMSFLRQSRKHIEAIQEMYPLLFNRVDSRNLLHIRWLKWLGFTFINYLPECGVNGEPFWEFVRIKT